MIFSADVIAGMILAFLLLMAAWSDVRSFRIPNVISLGGAVVGLGSAALQHGANGAMLAVAGWLVGMAALLPFYGLRVMAAGDVKLLGMTGAFLGFPSVLGGIVFTLMAGGVFALSTSAARGKISETFYNISLFSFRTMMPGKENSLAQIVGETPVSGHLPYAIAILVGTMTWWLMQRI